MVRKIMRKTLAAFCAGALLATGSVGAVGALSVSAATSNVFYPVDGSAMRCQVITSAVDANN